MKSKIIRLMMLGGLSAGTLFSSGCPTGQLWRFNPCGTILSTDICTPESWYARVFEYPDWGVDPACPIPFNCGGATAP